ncbi:hypothetical protein BVRB_3g068570 [Beta vulgaris subsp. vulgaris]|nr:hypothetical protein BVRB_3g068570 [Beta vulgaris subsp. vulgaris]
MEQYSENSDDELCEEEAECLECIDVAYGERHPLMAMDSLGPQSMAYEMARLHQTARNRTARKLTGPLSASPYLICMRYGEDVCDYVHRLNLAIKSYHFNDLYGDSDFCTPEIKESICFIDNPTRARTIRSNQKKIQ